MVTVSARAVAVDKASRLFGRVASAVHSRYACASRGKNGRRWVKAELKQGTSPSNCCGVSSTPR